MNARISADCCVARVRSEDAGPLIEQVAKSAIPKDFLRGVDISPVRAAEHLRPRVRPDRQKLLLDFKKLFRTSMGGAQDRLVPTELGPDRGIEQFATFIELAREEALPLAWVPNTDLTYLLLEADDDAARTEPLIEHQAAISRTAALRSPSLEEQSFLVTQLGRTIDACVAGFHESAQAHAASIIDTALRALFRTVGENNWSTSGR